MRFFDTYYHYRTGLKKLQADAEAELARLEKYKGSDGYREEVEKVTKRKSKAIKALQNECSPRFNEVIKAMRDGVSRLATEPPTEEEIRTLTLLKMRKNVHYQFRIR